MVKKLPKMNQDISENSKHSQNTQDLLEGF